MRGMPSNDAAVRGAGRRPGRTWRLGAAVIVGAAAVALVPAALALAATSSRSAPAAPTAATKLDAGDPSSTQTTTANVSVGQAIVLSGLTPSFVLSGLPGDTVTNFGAVSMNVLTNNATGYNVTVQAVGPNLTATGGGTIPVTDLLVNDSNVGGTAGFIPISSTTATQVFRQSGPTGDQGDIITNDYRITIPSVATGTYSGTLNYVASTNP
jgi:large repetitive protein